MKAKWKKEFDSITELPFCPACDEPLYEQDKCVFCGQEIETEPKLIKWFQPSPIETMDCFMCGGKDTVDFKRSKYNGHKRGRCRACGMTFIE